ncbi:MAG: T9SS type A sorting domain-containing protein [Chitinophagaceae bacterium]|nr:T9SS type A sorting domain-containing protein [Chitinophagaceae bacterium]MCW5904237.1 T9SS type A sorting domain-containing protein [Chitinophagaceae bacterium]
MKKIITLFFFSCLAYASTNAQDVIARWNFDGITFASAGSTTFSITTGDAIADSGALVTGSEFSGLHASASSAWTTPAGNGSAKSASANGWADGDYWQFKVSTTGYSSIGLVWDQMGSGTGPKSFIIQYSTDGSTFTDVPSSGYNLTNDSWNSGTYKPISTRTADLSSITALNNQPFIYIRFTVAAGSTNINGAAIASTGTSRIDNVYVGGVALAPLSLTSFTASAINGKAQLNWKTADEINVAGFDIEKSTNGTEFSKVGFVSANNEKVNSYSFTNEFSGIVYYRLKMNDKDGSYKYSRVVSLNGKQTVKLDIYPNPVRNTATLSHEKVTDKAVLRITTLDGRTVLTSYVQAGATQTTVDVSKLLSGNYIAVFESNGNRSSVQFIKQ